MVVIEIKTTPGDHKYNMGVIQSMQYKTYNPVKLHIAIYKLYYDSIVGNIVFSMFY